MRRLKLAMGFCFVVLLLAVPAMAEDDRTLGRKDFLNGLVISDERFSVLVIKEDEKLYFADIATALKWFAGACVATQSSCSASMWAHDYNTLERVHLRAAYYIATPKVTTPRASGLIAFKTEADALKALKELGGKGPLDFDKALDLVN